MKGLIYTEEELKILLKKTVTVVNVDRVKEYVCILENTSKPEYCNDILDDLKSIDEGRYDTVKNLESPMRFWFNEHREALRIYLKINTDE